MATGALAPARTKPSSSIDFFDLIQLQGSKVDDPDTVPDIIEFVLSPHFADRPLYPRQATFLKLMFLEEDLLTDFDYAVIEQWTTNGFRLPEAGPKPDEATIAYQGDWGIVPDVLQRIRLLKANGYRWFAIVLAVLGRRSGKGYIGGLAGAYVLWNFLQLYDPRDFFGIDRDKRLASQVFAGKKMQARDNQWRDIVNVILGAPCFEQYISQSLIEQLTVNTPSDLIKLSKDVRVATKMDQATFEVLPKESTTMAARGPASFMQFYDEMAHMVQTSGGADSAEKVYESATPSLDQFKLWSFIYSGSSPWTMTGKFYELVQQGLSVEADSLQPVFPEMLVLQLESWAIYEDWKLTGEDKPMVARPKIIKPLPYGQGEKEYPEIHFPRLKRAIQEYDDRMRKLERANPDTFAVERRSKWAAALDTYFPEQHVRRMFDPFQGEMLEMQQHGSPTITYVCHGDPGKTGSNFGFAIAHKVSVPGDPMPHVVFDAIRAWTPIDFDDGQMDYIAIEEDLGQYIDDFLPVQMTFDQWNCIKGDTLVQTRFGMVPIDKLVGDVPAGTTVDLEIEVPTKDGWGVAERGFHRGVIPTRRIRTKLGSEIEVSLEHRLWVERSGEWEWMEGRDIRVGDRLLARRNTSSPGPYMRLNAPPFDPRSKSVAPDVLTPSLGWLMGFVVAEGWIGDDSWTITQKSIDNLDRAKQTLAEVFGGKWSYSYNKDHLGKYQCGVIQGSGATAKFFRWIGCSGRSQVKAVPWAIWQSPRSVIEAFLCGLFDGDGGVTITEGKGEWVHFESTSTRLVEEVQQLLWSVGVFCSMWRGTYRYKGDVRDRARITIYGDDLVAFHHGIGFSDGAKAEKLDQAVRLVRSRSSKRRRSMSLDGDSYAIKVVSVVDSEADCYDIEVPGEESFIANGIVSHNSLGMIQRLAKHARRNFKVTQVFERTATAPINWRTAETMKTALSLNLVHAPFHELFELECLFLRKLKGDKVDHPDTGPVTTKDVYDAVSIVIQELIGAEVSAYLAEQFTDLPVVSGMPGTNSDAGLVDRDVAEQFSRFTAERQGRGRPNRAPTTGSFGRSRRR